MEGEKVAAVVINETKEFDYSSYSRELLETFDIIVIIICNPEYKPIRNMEVLCSSNLPVVKYHVTKIDYVVIFRALANTIRFFKISRYVVLPPNQIPNFGRKDLGSLLQNVALKPQLKLQWILKTWPWVSWNPYSSFRKIYGIVLNTDTIQQIYLRLENGIPFEKLIRSWETLEINNFKFSEYSVPSYSSEIATVLQKTNTISDLRLEQISKGKVSTDGVLDIDFHRINLYLDLPAFHYVYDRYKPADVLDLGCGLGGYIQAYKNWGCSYVYGVDGFDPKEHFLVPHHYLQFDLRKPLDLGKTFDLVLCLEVIEHIQPQASDDLLRNIATHAKELVIFSAARPGQPGNGHVNCQPISHWIEKWRLLGWEIDPFCTNVMRALSTYHWFRRNLLVLTKIGKPKCNVHLARHLIDPHEMKHSHWTNQPATTYINSLTEPLPMLSKMH